MTYSLDHRRCDLYPAGWTCVLIIGFVCRIRLFPYGFCCPRLKAFRDFGDTVHQVFYALLSSPLLFPPLVGQIISLHFIDQVHGTLRCISHFGSQRLLYDLLVLIFQIDLDAAIPVVLLKCTHELLLSVYITPQDSIFSGFDIHEVSSHMYAVLVAVEDQEIRGPSRDDPVSSMRAFRDRQALSLFNLHRPIPPQAVHPV